MPNLQQLADYIELQQLVVNYANAIDERAFERLDELFTPDAYVDYRSVGGIDGRLPAVKAWLPEALKPFPGYMHLTSNAAFDIQGDTATGRIACFNPMAVAKPEGGTHVMFLGLWYHDRYVRTPKGWRISERVEHKCLAHNLPQAFQDMIGL